MDYQQDYQNQQGQYYQRHEIKNSLKNISSLDAITDYAISALTEKASSYFHEIGRASCRERV